MAAKKINITPEQIQAAKDRHAKKKAEWFQLHKAEITPKQVAYQRKRKQEKKKLDLLPKI